MNFEETISLRKLHHNDVDSWIDFAWHYSPARFKKAFRDVGVLVEDKKDIISLSELARNNGDINGSLKNRKGQNLKFSVLDIIKSIPTDKKEIDNKFIMGEDYELIKIDRKNGIS